jgi:hypothetical protein
MKVSFDYDGTLQREDVQEYAKELLDRGVDVWVVTTRYDENHKHKYSMNVTLEDLWEVVDRLGIPRWKVRFTNMQWKTFYLNGTSFKWHLDDNDDEFRQAKLEHCSVPMIDVYEDFREQCEQLFAID